MTGAWEVPAAVPSDAWGMCAHGLPPDMLCLSCEGIDPADPDPAPTVEAHASAKGPSMATRLVGHALDQYTLGWAADGSGPCAVRHGSHLALPMRGGRGGLRGALARATHDLWGQTPSASALADAMATLEGYAEDTPAADVHLRVAYRDGAVWLDLGDDTGRVVKVTGDGWAVLDQCAVRFRRSELTGALPEPVRGGSLDDLWRFANVRPDLRPVLTGWLVSILLPDRPCPVAALTGEQGTGKSTATRLLGNLLDPSPAATRKPPKDIEAWVVAAAGSRVVAVDNLSGIPEWFSDSLCRAVTGDADVRRTLYTDGGLTVFAFRRAVILNGIDLGAVRPDLGDRLVPRDRTGPDPRGRPDPGGGPARALGGREVTLGPRRGARPRPPGSCTTSPPSRARHGCPGWPTMGGSWPPSTGSPAATGPKACPPRRRPRRGHRRHRPRASRPWWPPSGADWQGTAGELLALLDPHRPGPAVREWPRTARSMTGHLTRHAPALRRLGWTVESTKDQRTTRCERWRLMAPAPADDPGEGLGL